jgi:hypothetical protein
MDTRGIITWGANPDITNIIIIITITKEKLENKNPQPKNQLRFFLLPLPTRAPPQPFGLVP